MSKKLFSERQVDLSAFLGGPIPAGILIFKNHSRLGDKKIALQSLIGTFVFTILFFYLLLQIPEYIIDKIPSFAFSSFYALIVIAYFRFILRKDVNNAFEQGIEKASNWTVVGYIILGIILNILILFALTINEPYYDGELIKYKNNELYYHSPDVSLAEAEALQNLLISYEFFDDEYANYAQIENINGTLYITLSVDKEFWSHSETIGYFQNMKLLLAVNLKKPIELKLESVSLIGEKEYKYIN